MNHAVKTNGIRMDSHVANEIDESGFVLLTGDEIRAWASEDDGLMAFVEDTYDTIDDLDGRNLYVVKEGVYDGFRIFDPRIRNAKGNPTFVMGIHFEVRFAQAA